MIDLITETGLYLVTEDQVPAERRLRAVEEALRAGGRVVQLRDKGTPKRLLLEEARAMKALCARFGAVFIVNDDVALALCCDADGVHVGQEDLPADEARRLLGPNKIIGLSTHAADEAKVAARLPVDYVAIGAMYASVTKDKAVPRGLDALRAVRPLIQKPLVAIGGITVDNAADVFHAGADSVAIVNGVFGQPDIGAATRRLLDLSARVKGRMPVD